MPRVHHIEIDPWTPMAQQGQVGHNRWHEAIPPALEVEPGDTVILETRDAFDGQLTPASTAADVGGSTSTSSTRSPGRSSCAAPSRATCWRSSCWRSSPTRSTPGATPSRCPASASCAISSPSRTSSTGTSPATPTPSRRRCPACASAAAPSPASWAWRRRRELRERATRREADAGGARRLRALPEPDRRRPGRRRRSPTTGLRTVPPRETAGNIDIKQLTPGVSVLLPVYAEGALFSTGDVHFAQGDCEACGTAIEMRSRVHVQFRAAQG